MKNQIRQSLIIPSNRLGNTKIIAASVVTMVLLLAAFIGYTVWSDQKQQTAFDKANEPGAVPDTLTGKAATYSIVAKNQAADNPQTSQVNVPVYVIKAPTLTPVDNPTEITGAFVADGTVSSATLGTTTDVTTGINVGDKVLGIAANGTYYGIPGPVETLNTQSGDEVLKVYATNGGDGLISIKDKDDNTLGQLGIGTNLTLGSGQSEKLKYLRFEQNKTNTAYYFAGFFIDVNVTSNLTSIKGSGNAQDSDAVSYGVTYSDTTTGLERTQRDDFTFRLSYPVMLIEFDSIQFNDITFTADGDGCNSAAGDGEDFVFHFFDANWFRSAKSESMRLGSEDDTVTPTDVGSADRSVSYSCTA